MQRKWLLHSSCQTSISDYAFPKPWPWHGSGRTQCWKSCWSPETTKGWAFREFSASPLRGDAFLHRLARGIPCKEGVPQPLQSKVRTPPPQLCGAILTLQITLNMWLSPHLLHSHSQYILQLLYWVQAVVVHQIQEEAHRPTQRVALYPTPHQALPALPHLSAVLKTCLPA